MATQEPTLCPQCRQRKYRKVRGIVSEGTSSTEIPSMAKFDLLGEKNAFWYETTREMHSTTKLAERLLIPLQPLGKSPPHPNTVKETFIRSKILTEINKWDLVIIFSIILCGGAVLYNSSSPFPLPFLFRVLPLAAVGLFIFALSRDLEKRRAWRTNDLNHLTQEQIAELQTKLNHAERKHEEYLQKVQINQHAFERYNRLNYCYVCDAVFDPEDRQGRAVSPERMATLLYS